MNPTNGNNPKRNNGTVIENKSDSFNTSDFILENTSDKKPLEEEIKLPDLIFSTRCEIASLNGAQSNPPAITNNK